jgi:hypothetical protein
MIIGRRPDGVTALIDEKSRLILGHNLLEAARPLLQSDTRRSFEDNTFRSYYWSMVHVAPSEGSPRTSPFQSGSGDKAPCMNRADFVQA